jgi:hypothetical protein
MKIEDVIDSIYVSKISDRHVLVLLAALKAAEAARVFNKKERAGDFKDRHEMYRSLAKAEAAYAKEMENDR